MSNNTFQSIGNAVGILRPGFTILQAITDDVGTTQEINVEGRSCALVRSPDSSVSSVTLFAAGSEGGLFSEVTSEGQDVVVTLIDDKWSQFPVEFAGCRFIKLVGDADGQIEITGF